MSLDGEERRSQVNSGQASANHGILHPNGLLYKRAIAHVGTSRHHRVELLITEGTLWQKGLAPLGPQEGLPCEQMNTRIGPVLFAGSPSEGLHLYGCCLAHIISVFEVNHARTEAAKAQALDQAGISGNP